MKTTEKNKLIAEFMGLRVKNDDSTMFKDVYIDENGKLMTNYMNPFLQYHTSWGWLMPVVEKIHSPMKVKIYGVYRDINGEDVQVIIHRSLQSNRYITLKIEYGRRFKEFTKTKKDGETMLETTYRFVVEFIKWYNENKGG